MDADVINIGRLLFWAITAIATVFGVTLMFFIRRLLNLEHKQTADMNQIEKDVAVLSANQRDLKDHVVALETRNAEDHTRLVDRIERHHTAITARLDSLLKIARNGHS